MRKKHKGKNILKGKNQLSVECLNHTPKDIILQDVINIFQMFYCACLDFSSV